MPQTIYGINPVYEALKAKGRKVQKIYIAQGKQSPRLRKLALLAENNGIEIFYKERNFLNELSKGQYHQGVVGLVDEYRYQPLEDLLYRKNKGERLLIILDGIEDPQNLGSLIRSASLFEVNGIILPKRRSARITPLVGRASAGATEYVPVAMVINIPLTLDFLKEKGFWIVGASMEAEKKIYQFDFKTDIALVIGGEGKGIHSLVKKRCDFLVSIPTTPLSQGGVGCLNASVAGGIILYEIWRQRHHYR